MLAFFFFFFFGKKVIVSVLFSFFSSWGSIGCFFVDLCCLFPGGRLYFKKFWWFMLNFIIGCCFFLDFSKWGELIIFLGLVMVFFFIKGGDFGLLEDVFFFIDSMGILLVLLSIWIVSLSVVGSIYIKNKDLNINIFLFVNLCILVFLVLSFSVKGLLFFYFRFECSLIPIFFLVLGWGYQPERVQAGLYLLFYTLVGSFPLFFYIVSLFHRGVFFIDHFFLDFSGGLFVVFFISAGFLIKLPIYGVHLWLLKAHVESPVGGSIILAGVLLKLGGYGLIRFRVMWEHFLPGCIEVIVLFGLWGRVIMGIHCLRFIDIKLLVAGSSVVHIGICVSCIFYISEWSFWGVLIMIVSHGLCSSGLFYLCGVIYERTGSRSIFVNKGILGVIPSYCMWWFFICRVNMAAPPSLNLLSEIVIIRSLLNWCFLLCVPFFFLSFFRAVYRIFLYSLSQHGRGMDTSMGLIRGILLEFLVIFLHWVPVNLCFFFFLYF